MSVTCTNSSPDKSEIRNLAGGDWKNQQHEDRDHLQRFGDHAHAVLLLQKFQLRDRSRIPREKTRRLCRSANRREKLQSRVPW